MKADLSSLLGDGDSAEGDLDVTPRPSVGDALGEEPDADEGASSGASVTEEAKKDAGGALLRAFESKDPSALYDAVAGVLRLEGLE